MTDAPDTEHTPRDFGSVDDENDYTAAQRAAEEKAEAERCGRPLAHWENPHISTPCGRPLLHDGDCHPVPLAGDRKEGEDE